MSTDQNHFKLLPWIILFNAAYVKTVIVLMNTIVYKTNNDEDPLKNNNPKPSQTQLDIDLLVMVY